MASCCERGNEPAGSIKWGEFLDWLRNCRVINPLNAELNPICHLLALLGAHHIFHVSGLRVKDSAAWR